MLEVHCLPTPWYTAKKAFVILRIAFVTRIARTQHTWSTGTSEVATRAGKFA